jgi:hypothetical protein
MRRAARVDANHAAIVAALRRLGCSVLDLSRVGDGCPDLLVGFRGRNYLMELKYADGILTTDQHRFLRDWRGRPVLLIHSVEEAVAVLNAHVDTRNDV